MTSTSTGDWAVLSQLRVRNYALIEEVTMDFSPKLNIITGETGTGKSILVGALSLLLGARAGAEIVRTGADRCTVEAVFDLPPEHPVLPKLEALGVELEEDDANVSLILRREVTASGKGRCRANDATVTLRQLKAIGDLLVDLHGQHEHQSLLDEACHIDFLDGYVGLSPQVALSTESWRELHGLREELKEYEAKQHVLTEQHELQVFQLKEIRQAGLEPGEEERLRSESAVLANSQQLIQTVAQLSDALYEGEDSVSDRLGTAQRALEEAAGIDPGLKARAEALRSLLYELQDLSSALRSYADSIETDPERLEVVEERLALIGRLRKKYGGSVEEVIAFGEKLEEDLGFSENLDELISEKKRQIEEARSRFEALCKELSGKRKRSARNLAGAVEQALGVLGMPNAKFSVNLALQPDPEGDVEMDGKRYAAGPKGLEKVAFFISANPGEPELALSKVASGGEISRVMLSLKSTMAEADTISTLIFDEIDIGISGRIAEAVGAKLRDLARTHQTISITHLPQIAKMASRHFSVTKEVQEGRTLTQAVVLDSKGRAEELAKLLGGATISDITRKHAEEMLKGSSA